MNQQKWSEGGQIVEKKKNSWNSMGGKSRDTCE